MANLKSLTDLEIYNCPKMTRFPVEIAQMPELVSVNISNNAQWSAEELYKGLDAIANGPSKEKLQILYATNNNLREIPESFSNLKKIGLLDLSKNQIETLHPLGKEVAPVQLYLDHNNITSLPANSDGIFCGTDDTETFSVTYNKLKKVPNIFSAKSKYAMKSVDFSYNEIDGFEGEEEGKYKGLRVETFTLAANPGLTKFPKCLGTTNSLVSYIILRGCSIDEIPEGSFSGKNSTALVSLDLTYNKLKTLSKDFTAEQLPYLYGLDISYNSFDKFPFGPLNCAGLTVYAIRGQRDADGKRCPARMAHGALPAHGPARVLHRFERPAQDRGHDLLPDLPPRHQRQSQHHVRCLGHLLLLAAGCLQPDLRQDPEHPELRQNARITPKEKRQ